MSLDRQQHRRGRPTDGEHQTHLARHYDDIGLLAPSRVSPSGMCSYDAPAIRRLQRILLMRQLGVGLPAIAAALDEAEGEEEALHVHVEVLRLQREQLDRQIAAVEQTIAALRDGGTLMPEQMFDGFDHTRYRAEVEQRWGRAAYRRSDRWWRGLDAAGRQSFCDEAAALSAGWQQAWVAGLPLDSAAVRDLAARHVAWVSAGWGGVTPSAEQIADLAEMYVADERFAANYGGPQGAGYVKDALLAYVS